MELLERFKGSLLHGIIAVTGVVMLGLGLVNSLKGTGTEEVIISQPGELGEMATVVVDISGAVQQPGVYQFDAGVRVEDVLAKAGGFDPNADHDWVQKQINRAQPVEDGMKLYIPYKELSQEVVAENQPRGFANTAGGSGEVAGISTQRVNVNQASQSELEALWGIGSARSEAIVANRPYSSLDELKDKASIPQNVIDRNAAVISFY